MTIRKVINIRIRIASASIFSGLLISAGIAQYQIENNGEPSPLAFTAFVIGFIAMLSIKFSSKCPACEGYVGSTLMNTGDFLSLSKKIHHCPLCAKNINEPL